MDAALAKKWMLLFNEKIQANKDYLSELDTPIGDGDHGGNMARGMAAVVENLEGKDFANSACSLRCLYSPCTGTKYFGFIRE